MENNSANEWAPSMPWASLPYEQMKIIMIKGALSHSNGDINLASDLLNIPKKQIHHFADRMKEIRCDTDRISDEERIRIYLMKWGSINNTQCRKLLNANHHRASYLLKKMRCEGILKKKRAEDGHATDCLILLLIEAKNLEFNAN